MKTMKRILATLAMAAVTGVTALAAPSSSVQVTLTIPQEALAGVSVPLDIRVRNEGAALELAPGVIVRATSPSGETFTALWSEQTDSGELEFGLTDEDAETLLLKPNATADLSVPAVPLTDGSWAHDQRIASLPGRWKLEVLLVDARDGSTIASNAATLVVRAPAAKDVWIAQALARGEMWAIADRVLAEQPDSPYFPYLSTAVRRLSSLEKIDIINRAIALHPASAVVPRLRYAVADYYGAEAHRVFFAERDFDKAVSLAEKGRAELAKLKNGKDAWSKLKGNQREGDFPSRAAYVELQRLQREKGTRKP